MGVEELLDMMSGLLIGYARVSTVEQDLTVQREGLQALGVDPKQIYVDHGLTGANRARPGLREALAACRAGDTLVVTKLDRLARSLPDARDIADELTGRQVKLNLGGSVYDPTDAVGRLLFNVLAMVAELRPTSSGCELARAWRPPRPKAGSAASGPSSNRARRRTSPSCTGPAATPPPSSLNCLASPAQPSTGRSSETHSHRRRNSAPNPLRSNGFRAFLA